MITITIYGLDQNAVMYYSRENTKYFAEIFECKEDEIVFVSVDNSIFHNGVEQNSWNALVNVNAPLQYKPVEKVVAQYFSKTLTSFSIHMRIMFTYFDQCREYEYYNESYPRFIKDENIKKEVDDSYYGEDHEITNDDNLKCEHHDCDCKDCECDDDCDCDEECECHHHHHHDASVNPSFGFEIEDEDDEEDAESDEVEDIFLGDAFDGKF